MKRLVMLIAVAAVFVLGIGASVALADKPPSPPGQGPCEHGNSGKPCRDDPQPDKGKDCEEHGPKEGGVNEDHCKGTTPPPPPTTTPDPTTPEETTPSTPTETTETSPPSTTPGEPSAPPTTPLVTQPEPSTEPSASQPTLEKQLEKQAKKNRANAGGDVPQAAATELPYTGLPLGFVALLGAALAGTGLRLRRMP